MALTSVANDFKVVQSVEPTNAAAGTINGTAVDWSQYNRVSAVIEAGVVGAAPHVVSAYLEHCDTIGGSYVVLDSFTGLVEAGDQTSYVLGASRVASSKKYVRARIVRAGANNSLVGATLVLSIPKQAPAS